MASTDEESIESAQGFEFSMPKGRDGSRPIEIMLYAVGCNLCNLDVPHGSAEGMEDNRFGPEPHAHGLFQCDVFGGERREFHDNPPKSISDTSLNSGRLTLA